MGRSDGDPLLLYWHVAYTEFVNKIDFDFGIDEANSIGDYWERPLAEKTNHFDRGS